MILTILQVARTLAQEAIIVSENSKILIEIKALSLFFFPFWRRKRNSFISQIIRFVIFWYLFCNIFVKILIEIKALSLFFFPFWRRKRNSFISQIIRFVIFWYLFCNIFVRRDFVSVIVLFSILKKKEKVKVILNFFRLSCHLCHVTWHSFSSYFSDSAIVAWKC